MAEAPGESRNESEEESIEEHEHLDPETLLEDVAHGERPEQPVSSEHSAYERRRTNKHPVGDEQAEINRSEESPA